MAFNLNWLQKYIICVRTEGTYRAQFNFEFSLRKIEVMRQWGFIKKSTFTFLAERVKVKNVNEKYCSIY